MTGYLVFCVFLRIFLFFFLNHKRVIIIKQTATIDQIYSGILVYSGFQRNPYFESSNSCGSSIKWKCIVNKRNKSCNAYIYTLIYSIVFNFLKWLIETSPEEGTSIVFKGPLISFLWWSFNQPAFEDYRCCF